MRQPRVACLMGTYGRVTLASEALACFLQQTAIDDAVLIIYNQHPTPLAFDHPRVLVFNETPAHQGLRFIRRRMMELMPDPSVEFIHWWDDDDLYLPWHLEDCLTHIRDATSWKPTRSWYSERNTTFALAANRFEGSWLMRTEAVKAAPFDAYVDYTDHPFMVWQEELGLVRSTDLGDLASYVYRWENGSAHLSTYGVGTAEKQSADIAVWRAHSNDVRDDGRLVPADLWPRWTALLDGIRDQVSPTNHIEIEARLGIADTLSKLGAGGGT